jgi:hypothetical protein
MWRLMIPEVSTKTTPREEWSYIALVLKELLSISFSQVYNNLWKKLWKKALK